MLSTWEPTVPHLLQTNAYYNKTTTFLLTVRSVPSTRRRLLNLGKTFSKNVCKAGRSLKVTESMERRSWSDKKKSRGESLRKDQRAVESKPFVSFHFRTKIYSKLRIIYYPVIENVSNKSHRTQYLEHRRASSSQPEVTTFCSYEQQVQHKLFFPVQVKSKSYFESEANV